MSSARPPKPQPVRVNRVIGQQIWRVPLDGYLTPRLQKSFDTTAIGFVHEFKAEEDE